MPLHPEFDQLLAQLAAAAEGQPENPPLDEQRAALDAMLPPAPEIAVGDVRDVRIPVADGEIDARVYRPAGDGLHPLVMFFHGGGWVLGGLDTHDAQCRDLCNGSHSVVLAVDYRLAPEHRFPTAAEDCYAALCWAAARADSLAADPQRMAVVGDSAGGNLATVVALMARDRGGPALRQQVLVYPVVDADFDTDSYRANADGYLLTRDGMVAFWDQYCPDVTQRDHPYASPLRAGSLAGLPPALVLTGEYDPLRDEGEAYGARLEAEGVATETLRYEGFPHFFIGLSRLAPAGRAGMDKICATLRIAFDI